MKLSEKLVEKIDDYIFSLYGGVAKKKGDNYFLGDATGSEGESLVVFPSGAWKDFNTGEKGSLIGLMMARHGIDFKEACRAIESEFLCLPSGSTSYSESDNTVDQKMEAFQKGDHVQDSIFQAIVSAENAPKEKPEPPEKSTAKKLPPPEFSWEPCPQENPWTNGTFHADGTVSVYRFELADGTCAFVSARIQKGDVKTFRIAHFADGKWIQKAPKMASRPLFNLPAISAEGSEIPIILVEGEKKCVKAQKVMPQFLWTCWHGGAASIDCYDLKHLEGRKVILWPDNDDPGAKVMAKIAAALSKSSQVSIVSVENDWQPKDDVADILDTHGLAYTLTKIQQAIDALPDIPIDGERNIPDDHREANQLGATYRFIDLYGHEVRFLAEAKDWVYFDGRKWRFDRGGFVWTRLIKVIERTPGDCGATPASLKYLASAKTTAHLGGIETGAKRMDGMCLSETEMDKDDHLLNCLNGVVNLVSGEKTPHNKSMFMSKIVEVNYDPMAEAPEFMKFLRSIMCGDESLVEFLQIYFGYSLTGLPPDRIFAIFYGSGRNGKSTLMQIISAIMGDYHVSARVQSIMQTNQGPLDKIGEDLIPLRGARLASMQEAEKGVKLNEGKIKELTGRDRLKCRYLHSNLWLEWVNTAKLVLSTNHKPRISGTDSGIWDRVALVPFLYRIPDEALDPDLPDRIVRDEAAGVLSWMVQGAVKFYAQNKKIHRPDAIKVATNEYRNDEDIIGRFADQCVVEKDSGYIKAGEFYLAYKNWMIANQDNAVMGNRNFHEQITSILSQKYKIKKVRRADGVWYSGVRLLEEGEAGILSDAKDRLPKAWSEPEPMKVKPEPKQPSEAWEFHGEPLF